MVLWSRNLMGFPLPLPRFCRGSGKRKREVAGAQRGSLNRDVEIAAAKRNAGWPGGERSGNGEAVPVGGFDDTAGRGHRGEAFVESGGSDTAGCAQFGEWPRFASVCESRGDALIHGDRLEAAVGLGVGLDWLQGEGVVTLGEFERYTWCGGSGAMLAQ